MKKTLVVLLLLVVAVGCGQVDLNHELSEADADEILVLLSTNGIDATKTKEIVQQRTTWKISVAARHAAKARELLIQHNMPRKRSAGLAEVYKDKGLIPSPDEQKARFLLALKGEIINSLERLPNIIDADVVLNVPDQPVFGTEKVQRPTGSVVLRARPGGEPIREDKIQQFIANAVEGMDPRDVAVIISYIGRTEGGPDSAHEAQVLSKTAAAVDSNGGELRMVQVGGLKLDSASAGRFKLLAGLMLVLLIIVSFGLLYTVFRLTRLKAGGGDLFGTGRTLGEGVSGALPAGNPQETPKDT